jgi:hypothetical protein
VNIIEVSYIYMYENSMMNKNLLKKEGEEKRGLRNSNRDRVNLIKAHYMNVVNITIKTFIQLIYANEKLNETVKHKFLKNKLSSFKNKLNSFFYLFIYYSYVHTRLGSFLPPAPTPSLTTHSTPSFISFFY